MEEAARKNILRWSAEGKKEKREVVGWLVGFFNVDAVILDAVLSSKTGFDHFFGAQGSLKDESDLTLALPRGLGIIGLFHSHPFGKGKRALFHSTTDDRTLESRSAKGDYLSLITDTKNAKVFHFNNGKKIGEVNDVTYQNGMADDLKPYCAMMRIRKSLELDAVGSVRKAVEEIREGMSDVHVGQEGVTGGNMQISKKGEKYSMKLDLSLYPRVFFEDAKEDDFVLESGDLLDLILLKRDSIFRIDTEKLGSVEIDLGKIRYAREGVPYKRVVHPKRRFVFKQR